MNWKDLKNFCNSLSEEQLEKQVIVWREEETLTKIHPEILQQDYYWNPEELEGCYPESEASEPIENLEKVYDKGDPVLISEFDIF